jgi:hypothetical protein
VIWLRKLLGCSHGPRVVLETKVIYFKLLKRKFVRHIW